MIPGYWLWFEPFECRVFLVFECRVLVRSGLVVVIQRVGWVMVWHGGRPGKSGAPQLTSTSSTSTLTATSVYHAYLIYMVYISTSYFSLWFMAPRAFTILYPCGTPTPCTKRSFKMWPKIEAVNATQYCQGVPWQKKSLLNEEKENSGSASIQWPCDTFGHPAHDHEQQQEAAL